MGKGRPQKYNRVSSQQKYMLRRLIMKEKMSVKQASEKLGINYSTAKTIMFAYRQSASECHSFSPSLFTASLSLEAAYVQVPRAKSIQIVSSIGGGDWMKPDSPFHDSTGQQKQPQF